MKQKNLLFCILSALFGLCLQARAQYTLQVGDKVSTDDGIYVVTGANLIGNPNFEDGVNGWKAGDNSSLSSDYFEVLADGGPGGLPCLHAKSGAGSGTAKSVKTGWALETGKTYVFRCYAYRTASGMSSNTQYSRLYLSDSETGTNEQIATIHYEADTWALTQIVFTASRSYLVANLGWLNAASSFACFYLGEVTASTEIATDKLEASISEARQLLSTTEEGTGKGQYTTAVRNDLQAAITAAEEVLAAASTQTEVNDANTALQAAIATYKAKMNPPFQIGVGYNIGNVGANKNLATSSGAVKVKTADTADSTQVFYFVAAASGNGYNIHDANGVYIYKDPNSNWDMKSGTDVDLTSKDAIFTVVDHDSYVLIKNANRSYLGTDATADGSLVYDDKSGGSATHKWTLVRHTPTAALEALVASARKLLATTEVGTEYYQVPQAAADALESAIAKAEAVCVPSTTYAEAAEASAALSLAIDTFNGSFNALPDFADGQSYVVRHYSSLGLTATASGNATITDIADAGALEPQLFVFEKAGNIANQYTIRSVADGTYLSANGDWNTMWAATANSDSTIVRIERLSGKYLGLKFIVSDTYLGSDATTSGAALYFNKAAVANSYWTIEAHVAALLDRTAFSAALAVADSLAGATVVGYLKGQYFQTDLDSFKIEIASLRSSAGKVATQEELDAVTALLVAAIADYKGKAHASDLLNRDDLQAEIAKARKTLEGATPGDLNGQYSAEAIAVFSAAITAAENGGNSDTQEAIDEALAALKQAEADFAAARVVIDYSALQAAIAEARKTLTAKADEKGEGAGKIPSDAFDGLEETIAAAESGMKGGNLNQIAVDEQTDRVTKAIADFLGSRVPNDYSQLQALVDEATDLIGKAERGEVAYLPEYLEDLKASLEKNGAALESTDQDVIDKAVKILRRDIAIFQIMLTGIDGVTLDALSRDGVEVRIYDLAGQRVTDVGRGIYVVRITADGETHSRKIIIR